jgi:hypothetical protein
MFSRRLFELLELDAVLFPLNKKSTQKEPYFWPSTL